MNIQQYLIQQGYNKTMVEKQFQKANLISRTELLKPRVAKNKRKVVPLQKWSHITVENPEGA